MDSARCQPVQELFHLVRSQPEKEPAATLDGRLLGDCRLTSLVGEGGMGPLGMWGVNKTLSRMRFRVKAMTALLPSGEQGQ